MSVFQKTFSNPIALLVILLSAAVLPLKAQTILYEDFQDGIPFKLVNRDGNIPDAGVDIVTDAWIVVPDADDNADTVAMSTSWYDPVDTADDWMITPLIHINTQSELSWQGQAIDPDYPDGYEVRISTTDTAIASFLANPPIFSTPGEQPVWTTHTIRLDTVGYANQDIYLAFRNNSYDMYLLVIDDILVRDAYPTDAKAISVQVPRSGCQLGTGEVVSVTIQNYGSDTLTSFNASYVVDDGNSPVTVTETVSASIAPNAFYTYTFTQGANLSTVGTVYGISAYVSAASDGNLLNDSLGQAFVINVVPTVLADTTYATSFETLGEILGWSAQDANNDTVSWFLASGTGNTGSIFYAYRYNPDAVTAANDWLFSTCLDMESGTQYELKFFYRVGNSNGAVYPEKLKIGIGITADAASMTTIDDLGELTNDFFQEHSTIFTVNANGTYFIGFHCYSEPDEFLLLIDDVSVEVQTPPVAGFTTSKDELEVTFLSTSTGADSLHWDFDDGTDSTGNLIVHTFATPGTYYVCLTAYNEAGSSTFCDSVTVDTTTVTGIALINEAEFRIYPNPTQGALTVELNKQVIGKASVIVSNVVGKDVLNLPVSSVRMTFDLSDKPDGIYFITLQAGDGQLRRKVILAR